MIPTTCSLLTQPLRGNLLHVWLNLPDTQQLLANNLLAENEEGTLALLTVDPLGWGLERYLDEKEKYKVACIVEGLHGFRVRHIHKRDTVYPDQPITDGYAATGVCNAARGDLSRRAELLFSVCSPKESLSQPTIYAMVLTDQTS